MKVAVKYCGTCNPQTDLVRVARDLTALAESRGVELVRPTEKQIDLMVILNACPVACADRPDIRKLADRHLVVTADWVNGKPVGGAAIQAMELALEEIPGKRTTA